MKRLNNDDDDSKASTTEAQQQRQMNRTFGHCKFNVNSEIMGLRENTI